jgi:hypothetical protein
MVACNGKTYLLNISPVLRVKQLDICFGGQVHNMDTKKWVTKFNDCILESKVRKFSFIRKHFLKQRLYQQHTFTKLKQTLKYNIYLC